MDKIEQFKRQLETSPLSAEINEIGQVVEVGDGIVKASGLMNVENFEMVEFERARVFGLVLNLEEYETGIIVLGPDDGPKKRSPCRWARNLSGAWWIRWAVPWTARGRLPPRKPIRLNAPLPA